MLNRRRRLSSSGGKGDSNIVSVYVHTCVCCAAPGSNFLSVPVEVSDKKGVVSVPAWVGH